MGMLSEDEKRELRSLAHSSTLREEFRLLRKSSYAATESPVDIDRLLSFLTTMSRLGPTPAKPKPFVPYTVVRI